MQCNGRAWARRWCYSLDRIFGKRFGGRDTRHLSEILSSQSTERNCHLDGPELQPESVGDGLDEAGA
jgi:hypothetical protein